MSGRLARRAARGLLRLTSALLPPGLRPWGMAMRHELDAVGGDRDALRFALGCIGFALGRAVAVHLLQPLCWPFAKAAAAFSSRRTSIMNQWTDVMRSPRATTAWCAVGAVAIGVAHMAAAGAPLRYLGVNSGALVLGLLLAWGIGSIGRAVFAGKGAGAAAVALAAILLLTALRGAAADGASRWITLGGLVIQPSLLLLPPVIIGFARSRDSLGTIGLVGAALALAIQPDRAMSGVLALGLLALALMRPDRNVMIALGTAMIGFMATLLRSDRLPEVPYVDGVLSSSFDVHPLAGAAVWIGAALMIAPAVVGWRHDRAHAESHAVFAAIWFGVLLAAALGNYPTPVVGYGGSAILGYVLSLVGLPRAGADAIAGPGAYARSSAGSGDRAVRAGLAMRAATVAPIRAS